MLQSSKEASPHVLMQQDGQSLKGRAQGPGQGLLLAAATLLLGLCMVRHQSDTCGHEEHTNDHSTKPAISFAVVCLMTGRHAWWDEPNLQVHLAVMQMVCTNYDSAKAASELEACCQGARHTRYEVAL